MWQFLLFLILTIVFHRLSKALQEQQEQQQKKSGEEKMRELFQTLGIPLPEEPAPLSRPQKPPKQKKIRKPPEKVIKFEPPQPAKLQLPIEAVEETKPEQIVFYRDKLEEGIVLSEILGPPKAYRIRRGGGIG